MASNIVFEDNSAQVKAMFEQKIKEALERIGLIWLKNVTNVINSRYGKPIVDTGRLRASMKYEVDFANKRVIVGSDVIYAIFVALGTIKMVGRNFMRDSIMDFIADYEKAVKDAFGSGWSVTADISSVRY